MRAALLALLVAAFAWASPPPAAAQRALSVASSETVGAWMIVCMRDLVTEAVACSMITPLEAFAGQNWQPADPAVISVTVEMRDGQAVPAIGIAAPDFGFAAILRFDERRAVRVEGNCDDSDCRVADAFAGPLAGELARSTTVLMRPASGNDLRAAVAGYGAAWARLQAVQAERARPGDAIADLVSPPEPARTPPLPSAPLTIVRFPRVPR